MVLTKKEIKLTRRENEIVWKLQNGWVFVTGRDFGAILTKGYAAEKIRLSVFYRMVNKGILYQEHRHFNYVLTPTGEKIKTKQPKNLPS